MKQEKPIMSTATRSYLIFEKQKSMLWDLYNKISLNSFNDIYKHVEHCFKLVKIEEMM